MEYETGTLTLEQFSDLQCILVGPRERNAGALTCLPLAISYANAKCFLRHASGGVGVMPPQAEGVPLVQ